MTDTVLVKPESKTEPEVSAGLAGKSSRAAKRIRWWTENLDRRMGDAEGGLESTGYTDRDQPGDGGFAKSQVHRRGPGHNRKFQKKPDGTSSETPKKDDGKSVKKNLAVFVGQIPFTSKEGDVRKLFDAVGKVKHFRWRTHPETKKFLGFAFVEFENKKSYHRAFQLHHSLVDGKPINVEATVAGGRGSKGRSEAIKDKTIRLQKAGAEALNRKLQNAANRPTKKNVAPENAEKGEIIKLPDMGDRTAAPPHNKFKQNGGKRKLNESQQKPKAEPEVDEKQSSKSESALTETPSGVHQKNFKKPRIAANFAGKGSEKEPSNLARKGLESSSELSKIQPEMPVIKPLQPKEPHLAALGQKRNHIKFDADE